MTDAEVRSFSNYGTELVTIDVGPEKTAFHIHKGILTSESPYFKAAFDGEFREATEKRIHLADTTSAIFQDFMDWLYFGSLPGGEVSEDPGSTHEETNCCFCEGPCRRPPAHAYSPFATLLVDDDKELEDYLIRYPQRNYKLYIFADSYDIPALRKKIRQVTFGAKLVDGDLVLAGKHGTGESLILVREASDEDSMQQGIRRRLNAAGHQVKTQCSRASGEDSMLQASGEDSMLQASRRQATVAIA
ncbi:hypothetical protein E6O75_ATG01667 [Venturia nashicola]|uniref:BTB domain-containing protein n=1 Tax=Venturia nashicola TaxID=86259 RepID=A0A4Z1NGL3_9PEZI|nr:hypothetical protein E6O75_ATG01667 [Venturia nashicola]